MTLILLLSLPLARVTDTCHHTKWDASKKARLVKAPAVQAWRPASHGKVERANSRAVLWPLQFNQSNSLIKRTSKLLRHCLGEDVYFYCSETKYNWSAFNTAKEDYITILAVNICTCSESFHTKCILLAKVKRKKLEYTVVEEVSLVLGCGFEEYTQGIVRIDLTGIHLNKKYSFLC